MGGRRALVCAIGAIAAAGAGALVPLTPAASLSVAPASPTPARSTPTPGAARAALGPVTEHPVDPALLAGASSGGSTVVEVIQVTVIGGELRLETTHADVVLRRDGDRLVGTLPPIRVVDARGTHDGWEVRARVAGVVTPDGHRGAPPSKVTIAPSTPVVVAGLDEGLSAPSEAAGPGWRRLFAAAPGTGGGTYEGGGRVELALPPGVDLDEAVVEFAFAVR